MRRFLIVLLSVLAFASESLVLGSEALAQDAAPSLAALEEARTHMERGQQLYLQGSNIEAGEEFLAAHRSHPHAAFLFNAGVAFERQQDWRRAITQFSRYITDDPRAPDRAAVEARIAQIQAFLPVEAATRTGEDGSTVTTTPNEDGTITTTTTLADGTSSSTTSAAPAVATPPPAAPAASTADIKSIVTFVTTNPAHAHVTIRRDGQEVSSGDSPYSASLPSGRYEVTFEHPEFRTQTTPPLDVTDGQTYIIQVDMAQGDFSGLLNVVTNVPGASVFVDNREQGALGRSPFLNQMTVGRHRLWIEKPGYTTIETEVEVQLGAVTRYVGELTRVANGRLRAVANIRGASVYVDGELVGVVPFEGDVLAGPHAVRIDAEGMKAWQEEVTILQGQVTPVRVRLRPSVTRTAAWVTASISAVTLAGGIVVGVLGNELRTELEADRNAGILASNDPRIAQGRWMYIGANVGFGLSAILAGLAVYYFVRDPLPDSEATVLEPRDWAVMPEIAPGFAGGSVLVRF
jgi:hypothetical protein